MKCTQSKTTNQKIKNVLVGTVFVPGPPQWVSLPKIALREMLVHCDKLQRWSHYAILEHKGDSGWPHGSCFGSRSVPRAYAKSGSPQIGQKFDMGCQLLTCTIPCWICRGLCCRGSLATPKLCRAFFCWHLSPIPMLDIPAWWVPAQIGTPSFCIDVENEGVWCWQVERKHFDLTGYLSRVSYNLVPLWTTGFWRVVIQNKAFFPQCLSVAKQHRWVRSQNPAPVLETAKKFLVGPNNNPWLWCVHIFQSERFNVS